MTSVTFMSGSRSASTPSPQILKAARSAVASPHALINLTRLVKSLDAKIPASEPDDSPLVDLSGVSVIQRRKDWESLLYARAALHLLRNGNEGSSTSNQTINELIISVNGIIARYEATVGPSLVASSRPTSPVTLSTARAGLSSVSTEEPNPAIPNPVTSSMSASIPPPQASSTTRRRRPVPSISEYLSKREHDDARGGEAGLLPLASAGPVRSLSGGTRSQRDQLLAGQRSEGVMGNSQLHEELGGQLAEMSHRLKLNAIHFSNSLEAEKSLLDSSQQTLEHNLTATQASKKQLGSVSSKGRGTTCLTLGVILLVLIIFVWTYMLIRFT